MKKSHIITIVLLFVLAFALSFSFLETKAADIVVSEINETNYVFVDLKKETFDALYTIKKVLTDEEETAKSFKVDFFSVGYKDVSPQSEEGKQIKSDLESGNFYLTTGEDAKYESLKSIEKLTSLSGLNNLKFDEFSNLDFSNNNIYQIDANDLSSFSNVISLDLSGNNLTSVGLPILFQESLENINLSKNKITRIDLSRVKAGANVDLSKNKISNIFDINTNHNLESLNLSFNNILNLENLNDALILFGCTPLMQVQGDFDNLKYNSQIDVFREDCNIEAVVNFREDSEFSGEIFRTDKENFVSHLFLPAGKIEIEFLNILDDTFSKISIDSKLNSVTYKASSNGQVISNLSSKNDISVDFELKLEDNLDKELILQNAKIYYEIGSAKENLSKLKITKTGKTSVTFYAVFDGIEGEKTTITIEKIDNSRLTLAIVLISLLVVAIFCGIYLVIYAKNGGFKSMTPLTDREMGKIKNKENKEGNVVDILENEKEGEDERL